MWRSILALGTAMTLAFHDADTLFRPLAVDALPSISSRLLARWSLFSLVPPGSLEVARWSAIVVLALVASGWRPRLTGVPHWWVTSSFAASSFLVDGGDHVAAVLSLLLVPVTLTDPRRWHWGPDATHAGARPARWHVAQLVASSSFIVIRLQVAVIYFIAGVSKLRVEEWANGTALWFWLNDPTFGMPGWMEPLAAPLVTNRYTVVLATWGVVALEVLLFTALVMERRWRKALLPVGLLFHLAIVFLHGLASFFLSMTAALILLLWPVDEPLPLARLARVPALERLRALLPRRAKAAVARLRTSS